MMLGSLAQRRQRCVRKAQKASYTIHRARAPLLAPRNLALRADVGLHCIYKYRFCPRSKAPDGRRPYHPDSPGARRVPPFYTHPAVLPLVLRAGKAKPTHWPDTVAS